MITYVGEIGAGAVTSSVSSLTLTLGTAVSVGDVVIIRGVGLISGGTAGSISSITDSSSNTWDATNGICVITSPISIGGTIVLHFPTNIVSGYYIACAFRGLSYLTTSAASTGLTNVSSMFSPLTDPVAPLTFGSRVVQSDQWVGAFPNDVYKNIEMGSATGPVAFEGSGIKLDVVVYGYGLVYYGSGVSSSTLNTNLRSSVGSGVQALGQPTTLAPTFLTVRTGYNSGADIGTVLIPFHKIYNYNGDSGPLNQDLDYSLLDIAASRRIPLYSTSLMYRSYSFPAVSLDKVRIPLT